MRADASGPRYAEYATRPVEFRGVRRIDDYRLKVYSIVSGDRPLDGPRFEEGWQLLDAVLPRPAVSGGRPGVGFVILHQGATGDYLVICWWDNENELPTRVFVHDASGWRPAGERESFCVWDLEVLWRERQLYVATVLGGLADAVDTYATTPITDGGDRPGT